jgi:hypothetical protein
LLQAVYFATLYQWVCCVPDSFPLLDELRLRMNLVMEGIAS